MNDFPLLFGTIFLHFATYFVFHGWVFLAAVILTYLFDSKCSRSCASIFSVFAIFGVWFFFFA